MYFTSLQDYICYFNQLFIIIQCWALCQIYIQIYIQYFNCTVHWKFILWNNLSFTFLFSLSMAVSTIRFKWGWTWSIDGLMISNFGLQVTVRDVRLRLPWAESFNVHLLLCFVRLSRSNLSKHFSLWTYHKRKDYV